MTEEEARARVLDGVPRETAAWLDRYVGLLLQEAVQQNLIAASTHDHVWQRHILDSAQLLALAPTEGAWVDLGSGAGLPGLVVAALTERPVYLVEPRAKRCAFLSACAVEMGLESRVTIVQSRAETAAVVSASVISARAVAALPDLFAMGLPFAAKNTVWVLPKGRRAAEEVAAAGRLWHSHIELVPSQTDSEAAIVVATDVRPRNRT